jgi:hypothetical protein
MALTNIFIAKLLGVVFLLSAFMNYRRGHIAYLNLKKGDVLFTMTIIGKVVLGIGLILLPNITDAGASTQLTCQNKICIGE